MGEVARSNAPDVEQYLSPFVLFPAYFQYRPVHLDGFGGIEDLHIQLGDILFDRVFAFVHVQLGDAVVQLLLLDGVHPLAAVIHGPVGIDAIATVVRSLAFACRDVIAADDGAACTVRAVNDSLADVSAQGGQEIRLGCLYVFLGTFSTDTVSLYGDVMLQRIIDAIAKRPLLGCVSLCFHPGGQEEQTGEEYGRNLFHDAFVL